MRKYLLLTLLIAVMPAAARACSPGGDAAGKAAQTRELGERLAKSEYVVEKGELAHRPGAAAAPATTPLGRDEEFQMMKRALAAARSKLTVADGSGVVLDDGKEFYEVVIGGPAPADSSGKDYAAKVLIDKKSLAVVQVMTEDMNNSDEKAARKVEQFRKLSEKLAKSEYVVEKGEVVRRPGGDAEAATKLSRDEEFQVVKKGFDAARAKLSIPEGSGVVIAEGKENYEIIIGNPPPAGSLGPDYTAKVMIDKKSLAVVQILAGS